MIRSLILVLTCTGCAPHVFKYEQTELKAYVQEFNNIYNIEYRGSYRWANPGELRVQELAVCAMYGRNLPMNVIRVDPVFWEQSNEIQREQLIFHELGHCALGLRHDDKALTDGCPASLMSTYQVSDECYFNQRREYLDNLNK